MHSHRAEILCATKHFQAFIQNHKAREAEKIREDKKADNGDYNDNGRQRQYSNTTTNELKYTAKSCVLLFFLCFLLSFSFCFVSCLVTAWVLRKITPIHERARVWYAVHVSVNVCEVKNI